MKIVTLLIGISLSIFANLLLIKLQTEHYVAPVQQVATTTPKVKHSVIKRRPTEQQIALIVKKAEQYGVSTTTLTRVISCESDFVETARGDGGHSRGLVQIHALYHPTITYEQAVDPEFAIDFLAKNVSEGRGSMWTCYRMLAKK